MILCENMADSLSMNIPGCLFHKKKYLEAFAGRDWQWRAFMLA